MTASPWKRTPAVPYSPTANAPNLLLWTGGRHALVLDLKDPDAPAVS